MVDYSKWDKLEVSSSGEEEEEGRGARPVVHRLDPAANEELRVGNLTVRSKRAGQGEEKPSTSEPSESACEISASAKGEDQLRALSRNGARCGSYLWSQDRTTCTLGVIVPRGSRASEVGVELSGFDYLGGTKRATCLSVVHRPSGTRVGGDLQCPCRAEDDDLLANWELKDLAGSTEKERVVLVELRKVSVADNVVVWWKRLFKGEDEPEVDINSIEDRVQGGGQSFAEVWNEAEKMFKEKLRKKS
ncbi:putative HSP20-like chaperone [Chloropicon primus]|uniref:Putative HSP20-like chaperone n=2 Tax=Chloropicon primus TaxID=1764295 RepID=A0A5B8MB47_9CHLO|nr:putative HSP20-like chaperone [Chloropicon primus]UPQ96805.1 putative HSP20-like chaperone [Chloropicon primus]|eukprot:QDZ17587.1 putative HSP20-like chaperone [Chloropicon primus]